MKRSRAPWCAAIAATFAVHGALLWGALTSPRDVGPPWVEPPAVELVRIQGGETAFKRGEAKAASEPHEAKPPTPTPIAPTPVTPQAASPALAAKPPQPVPSPIAAETHASQGAPAVEAAAAKAPAAPAAPPLRAGDAAGLDIDAPRGRSQDYAAMLRTWLEAHKTYPKHAKMRREEGVVHLRFAVDRRGHLLDGAVVRSSGVASLDREAMAMLDRSNPFPAAPHAVRGERIELRTPVEFYLR